jgi:uncharacterized protein (DUF983 family)
MAYRFDSKVAARLNRIGFDSFAGCRCPYCPEGRLVLKQTPDGTVNECSECGGQVVSERQWAEMQRAKS